MKKLDAVVEVGKKVGKGIALVGAGLGASAFIYTGALTGAYGAIKILEKVIIPVFTGRGWTDDK